ncbi:MAG: ATP-dependent RNA helicase DbpA [Pseudobacteriovorax sp.]|nr:ATP-dependent RNA helicase DbpA [Pseudobacteriovorax sp.]
MPTEKTKNFSQLNLRNEILVSLQRLEFSQMTEIQSRSLPITLGGHDLIGQAKTGSGKTIAFGLVALNSLQVNSLVTQGLVLCPTRELADQVCRELRKLATALPNVKILPIYGGVNINYQRRSLQHGAHIIVGTPGRVGDHLRRGYLQLDQLKLLVLDEADRMLDMGFFDSIAEIIEQTPNKRQTLLFSTTYPDQVKEVSKQFQRNPETVTVASQHTPLDIQCHFYDVTKIKKYDALVAGLSQHHSGQTLIFSNTQNGCRDLAARLQKEGYASAALHGGLEQRDRDEIWARFAGGSLSVLIATDVAARGLDVKGLPLVINYELNRDPSVFVHRMGRTGRAGERGLVITLIDTNRDQLKASDLEPAIGQSVDLSRPPQLTRKNPDPPQWVTLKIDLGKKQKLRPGDILGALTGGGLAGDAVGKIHIFVFASYVAIKKKDAREGLHILNEQTLKGRRAKARRL